MGREPRPQENQEPCRTGDCGPRRTSNRRSELRVNHSRWEKWERMKSESSHRSFIAFIINYLACKLSFYCVKSNLKILNFKFWNILIYPSFLASSRTSEYRVSENRTFFTVPEASGLVRFLAKGLLCNDFEQKYIMTLTRLSSTLNSRSIFSKNLCRNVSCA